MLDAQRRNIQTKLQCMQVNGCAGLAKCLRKSNAKKGCPKPRSGPLAGRCRGVSWRGGPRLCNAPFAQSGRAPSGAQLTALPGCMRFATVLLRFHHKVYQCVCVNTPCQPPLLLARLQPSSTRTCGPPLIIQCCITLRCFRPVLSSHKQSRLHSQIAPMTPSSACTANMAEHRWTPCGNPS